MFYIRMVNRVDGNNHYEYQKLKNVAASDSGEKFSLDYNNSKLDATNKNKDKTAGSKNLSQEENGVKLEISRQGQSAAKSGARPEAARKDAPSSSTASLLDSVKSFISIVTTAVKDFLNKLWNEPEKETAAETEAAETKRAEIRETSASSDNLEAEKADEAEAAKAISPETDGVKPEDGYEELDAAGVYRMDSEKRNREIQQYLHSGDLEQVLNLLTDNGKRTIARNSSLLTYYDKKGRRVEPNASDRERILNGDANVRLL